MNEQTKELAMKYANKMGNSVLHNAEFLEEFAELIVRECIDKADRYGLGCDAVEQLKEDFGVEE